MIKQNINYNDSLSKKNLFSRWILLFFIIIIYFFINQFKLIDPSDQSELVFFLCILLFAGFNYYLTILKKNGEIQKIQIFIIIAFDFVFATFVMLSVGRENSPFFILYYLMLLNVNVMINDPVKPVIIFALVLILYIAIAYLNYFFDSRPLLTVVNIFSLIIYFLTFEWAKRLKKRTQELNSKVTENNKQLADQTRKLVEQKKELDEKNKHYLYMLDFVTHELKTPLSPIQTLSSIHMLETEYGEDVRLDFEKIHKNALELNKMIHTFLALSKIESGNLQIEHQRMDIVADAIVYSVAQLEVESEKKGMRILKHLNSEIDNVITRSDPNLLRIVFNNLFSNAIKYGEKNSDITYKVKRKDDKIEITVSNFGPGIPADKLEAIFEKFERLETSKSSNIPGSGLGLFNTKSIIEKLNGRIYCESQPGYITNFIIILPIEGGDFNDDNND